MAYKEDVERARGIRAGDQVTSFCVWTKKPFTYKAAFNGDLRFFSEGSRGEHLADDNRRRQMINNAILADKKGSGRSGTLILICEYCGVHFSANSKQKYCSKEHRALAGVDWALAAGTVDKAASAVTVVPAAGDDAPVFIPKKQPKPKAPVVVTKSGLVDAEGAKVNIEVAKGNPKYVVADAVSMHKSDDKVEWRACQACGKPYFVTPGKAVKEDCCYECRKRLNMPTGKNVPSLVQCEHCGRVFVKTRKDQRVCSPDCYYQLANHAIRKRTCRDCGKEFEGTRLSKLCPDCLLAQRKSSMNAMQSRRAEKSAEKAKERAAKQATAPARKFNENSLTLQLKGNGFGVVAHGILLDRIDTPEKLLDAAMEVLDGCDGNYRMVIFQA